jgi:hypothetical protein
MRSRLAMTKLKAVLIVDVLIVVSVLGAYIYLQDQGFIVASPKAAQFTIGDLIINPEEAEMGEPILISVMVKNSGDEAGAYLVNLTINNILKQDQSVLLEGNESLNVEFVFIETIEGNHIVDVNGLSGSFNIKPAPLETSKIILSNLQTEPYESWVNEPISVTVNAHNPTTADESLTIRVNVDGFLAAIKRIELAGGASKTVEFTVNATTEGRHTVQVNTLSANIMIVPTGYHTLMIQRSGGGSGIVTLTINDESVSIPFSELVPVGTLRISIPTMFETATAVFRFNYWSDGVTSTSRSIEINGRTILVAQYTLISGVASCPSLFVWNGTNYVYRTEVSSGTGYLGIFDYFNEDGSGSFLYSDPWDYIKLDNTQIAPNNGFYDLTFTQLWDEIFYIDSVKLVAVDHASDVDVFSTKGTYLYVLDDLGTIYTVSKNPLSPVSAFSIGDNGEKTCILSQIQELDDVYTHGKEFHWDTLELDLGDLSAAEEIKLVIAGVISYSSGEKQGEWASQFWEKPGERPFPPPYMEVKIDDNWIPVPDNRQFPLLLVTPESFVVDLTGLFAEDADEFLVRIHTWFDSRFDYIGVDTSPQDSIITQTIYPAHAEFYQVFEPAYVTSTGNFTNYGYVTELLLEADDKFVIGRKGDSITVFFNSYDLDPIPYGMERDYFVIVSCWFKVPGLPYLPFTVDPLPFHSMSSFPYPDTENYPDTEDHLNYLYVYNNRIISNPWGE